MAKGWHRIRLETLFLAQIADKDIPPPEQEFRFHTTRRFRFDFAWPEHMIAAEVQGGQWVRGGGRHQRGSHLDNEYTKLNLAAIDGWRVLLFSTNMVNDGSGVDMLESMFRRTSNASTEE